MGKQPPEDLIGRRLAPLKMVPYRVRDKPEPKAWVGFGRGLPTDLWIGKSIRPGYARRGAFESVTLQYEAVRNGLGIAELPNFLAEQDNTLEPLPDAEVTQTHSLWLLRQSDTRNTARLKYVSDRLFDTLKMLD